MHSAQRFLHTLLISVIGAFCFFLKIGIPNSRNNRLFSGVIEARIFFAWSFAFFNIYKLYMDEQKI